MFNFLNDFIVYYRTFICLSLRITNHCIYTTTNNEEHFAD